MTRQATIGERWTSIPVAVLLNESDTQPGAAGTTGRLALSSHEA
jgi:hypothetical protein